MAAAPKLTAIDVGSILAPLLARIGASANCTLCAIFRQISAEVTDHFPPCMDTGHRSQKSKAELRVKAQRRAIQMTPVAAITQGIELSNLFGERTWSHSSRSHFASRRISDVGVGWESLNETEASRT